MPVMRTGSHNVTGHQLPNNFHIPHAWTMQGQPIYKAPDQPRITHMSAGWSFVEYTGTDCIGIPVCSGLCLPIPVLCKELFSCMPLV
jgi:hypothetical protein